MTLSDRSHNTFRGKMRQFHKFCFPLYWMRKTSKSSLHSCFFLLIAIKSMESVNLLMHTKNVKNMTCKLHPMEAFFFLSTNRLFEVHAHKQTQTQTLKHMSWRTTKQSYTVTTAAAAAAAAQTCGLGQRECDLQALPLSRRRKMGQNNRNRLRCVLHQLSPPHCMLPNCH